MSLSLQHSTTANNLTLDSWCTSQHSTCGMLCGGATDANGNNCDGVSPPLSSSTVPPQSACITNKTPTDLYLLGYLKLHLPLLVQPLRPRLGILHRHHPHLYLQPRKGRLLCHQRRRPHWATTLQRHLHLWQRQRYPPRRSDYYYDLLSACIFCHWKRDRYHQPFCQHNRQERRHQDWPGIRRGTADCGDGSHYGSHSVGEMQSLGFIGTGLGAFMRDSTKSRGEHA